MANLFQHLVPVVAKQTESKVIVDAADRTIMVEQEETAERSNHPNGSRVLQGRAGGEDNAIHFEFCGD